MRAWEAARLAIAFALITPAAWAAEPAQESGAISLRWSVVRQHGLRWPWRNRKAHGGSVHFSTVILKVTRRWRRSVAV